jgi:hypothetical protein
MNDDRGGPHSQNSFLLPAEVINNVPPQETDKIIRNSEKKAKTTSKNKKGAEKTWYGWLQGWWHGKRLVTGCIDVIRTGKLRVNLHVAVYERGKWPFFRKEYLVDQLTIQIPTSMIKDISNEITNHYHARSRKLPSHNWMKKRYQR